MKAQNYRTHRRFVPFFHFFLFGLLLVLLILALVQLSRSFAFEEFELISTVVLGHSVALIFLFFFVRIFSLKAQDRAIRAEENLRHFALTDKLLDPKLHVKQIVALRFASDEELPELAAKAAQENLKPDDIKMLVKNWRGDRYRV